MKYFDVYGEELNPRFQKFQVNVNTLKVKVLVQERIDEIMSKIQYNDQHQEMLRIIGNHH